MSKIEWTEKTWNPVTGCTKTSQGCKNCYAETMHRRLMAMGQEKYSKPFTQLRFHPKTLQEPSTWRKPSMVFVNSMSDLFHGDITIEQISKVFEVIRQNPKHTFQILTKRAHRLMAIDRELKWPDNLWLGVSIEDESNIWRLNHLVMCNAKVKFLSLEPLLGPLPNLILNRIDWVIVGGESGHKARPIKEEWVIDIRDQCKATKTPFFFKQWGGKNKKKAGRLLEGLEYNEMPVL